MENFDLTPPLLRDHPFASLSDPTLADTAAAADEPVAVGGTDGSNPGTPVPAAAATAAQPAAGAAAAGRGKEDAAGGALFIEINLRWIGRNPLIPPYLLVRTTRDQGRPRMAGSRV